MSFAQSVQRALETVNAVFQHMDGKAVLCEYFVLVWLPDPFSGVAGPFGFS